MVDRGLTLSPTEYKRRNLNMPRSGKVAIIYHAGAGRGEALRILAPACRRLTSNGWQVVGTHRTRYPGHARDLLAKRLVSKVDRIVVIGGDGTLREVCAGLHMAASRVPIGFVPTGSANVVARDQKIPLEASPAIDLLTAGVPKNLDVGRIQTALPGIDKTIFLAMVEIGFGARVVHLTHRLRNGLLAGVYRRWGDPVYVVAALGALVNPREAAFYLKSDRSSAIQRMRAAVFTNTQCYAKGWSMAPDAQMDDGWLDLVSRQHSSPGIILRAFYAASQGRHSASSCRYHRGRQFAIQSDRPLMIQVDGDPLPAATQLTIDIMPKQLRLIAPP